MSWRVLRQALDSARRIVSPGAIKVSRRSASRPPCPSEALALTVSALGALNRHASVRTMNLNVDGQPVAFAMIEGATFDEDEQGATALVKMEARKPE